MEILLCALFVGCSITMAVLRNMNRLKGWKETARACGLEVADDYSLGSRLSGWAGLLEVIFESSGDKSRPTQIAVVAPGPPDILSVKIRPESMFRLTPEITIGEESFDSEFFIEGPARLVSALLDVKMRRLLIDPIFQSRLEISSGEVRATLEDASVPTALRVLLDIGRRLAEPLDIPQRLADNARQDPAAGVRLHNLLVLVRELPHHPLTAEALRRACSDSSPKVRLRAAREVGDKGILQELIDALEDDDVSAEAVSTLGPELSVERLAVILEIAVGRNRLQTARAAVEALGATGSPAAEPALIQTLQRDDADLRVAVAGALGRVGTAAAVLPLREISDRLLPGETGRAARQAIAEIQARLQGASPGQLSLAGTEAGQLSLADDPAGRLSLGIDSKQP